MQIVLYDQVQQRTDLYPLTLTRPIADLRVGILTIAEKWEKWLKLPVSFLTESYLGGKYPLVENGREVLIISANICPDDRLCEQLEALSFGEKLVCEHQFIAAKLYWTELEAAVADLFKDFKPQIYSEAYVRICYPEDIFGLNGVEIARDFDLLTVGRSSHALSSTVTVLGEQIFVEEGVSAECCTINTLTGPVYLGKNSEIWEGAMIRGSFSLGQHAQVKMGAKIYSHVSVGPGCRVGGELNTCVLWGNSSKGHDGYLGNAVIGEWCNWGADSNNSNLKNNYKPVRLYHYGMKGYRNTGLQFCGVIMGDHSKCAINTAFNTGTVVGVSASIFGGKVPPTFIPDFSWGVGEEAEVFDLEKMFATAELVFARRNRTFDTIERAILREVFHRTK